MAKIGLTKLGLTKEKINSTKTIEYNGQLIEIKQYLPINDKLLLISNVINESVDDNNFYNPIKIELFSMINIVESYTNITFTDKQRSEPHKLYDLLESNKFFNDIINQIPSEEYDTIIEGIEKSIQSIYQYKNSIFGILDTISQDYSNLSLEATEIQKKLADPENMKLLKTVLTKLG